MTNATKAGLTLERTVTGIRWVAHALGASLLLLVVVISVGEGISEGMINPQDLTLKESLLFVAFIATLLGVITAW